MNACVVDRADGREDDDDWGQGATTWADVGEADSEGERERDGMLRVEDANGGFVCGTYVGLGNLSAISGKRRAHRL
jgi:hypothetical protein